MSNVGQFGVVRTHTLMGWLIRLATRSQVSHAYIYVSEDRIVEAAWGGARMVPSAKFEKAGRDQLHPVSRFDLTSAQQVRVAHKALDLLGTPYNFLDIACLGLLSLGIRWQWLQNRAQNDRGLICSQLVDRAYRNAGIHLYDDGRPDGEVTPGDLLLLLAERSTGTRAGGGRMSDEFRFGDRNARDDMGGCCGKPNGCGIESRGCVHKPEKADWQAKAAKQIEKETEK